MDDETKIAVLETELAEVQRQLAVLQVKYDHAMEWQMAAVQKMYDKMYDAIKMVQYGR